jgi:serine/threonine-protein kinase
MTASGADSSRAASISAEETRAYTLQPIPPQPFGKYTLVGKLGHGGMAEVLLAVMGGKAGFRKLVVLKRLHPQLEAEPALVDMFLDEARLAAQLDHPHCVQTLEVGDVDGQHFLAMEYLDGQGLERLLRASASTGHLLPTTTAVRIVADALDGLGYAHELVGYDGRPLGVVHRDVSPQNIFVTYNGVVKLLDFGIAKAESNVVETRTGVVKGKYAYIAPEQALGQKVDARADLWSMGVVLWECLTSRRLFKSVNELATLQETLHGRIPSPSEFNPAVPPELDAIAHRALQREVERRFQSAHEFKDALERWLATQPGESGRRAIADLLKERFEEVRRVHREKLAACLAALEMGPSSIQRLVDAGGGALGTSRDSAAFANMTPSSARLVAAPSTPPPATPGGATGAPQHGADGRATGALGAVPPDAGWSSTTGARHAGQPTALATPPADAYRSLAWKLVALGAFAVVAVAVAIALPRGGEPEAATGAGGFETVVPTAAPIPTPPRDPATGGATGPDVGGPGQDAQAVPRPEPVAGPAPEPAPATAGATGPEPVEHAQGATALRRPSKRHGGRRWGAGGEPAGEAASAAAVGEVGYLTLVTSPWTIVSVGGRELGETPLVRIPLPAGRHTLRLVNPEEGISETYVVEIRPGETTTRRLGLR